MRRIRMTIGSVVLEAELFGTPTAEAIWNALPFSSRANPRRSPEIGIYYFPVICRKGSCELAPVSS